MTVLDSHPLRAALLVLSPILHIRLVISTWLAMMSPRLSSWIRYRLRIGRRLQRHCVVKQSTSGVQDLLAVQMLELAAMVIKLHHQR